MNVVDTTKVYWLHIIESKSPAREVPSTYTMTLAPAPRRTTLLWSVCGRRL